MMAHDAVIVIQVPTLPGFDIQIVLSQLCNGPVMNTRQDSILRRGSTTFSINLDLTFPLLVGRQLAGYIDLNIQTPKG